jgi:quercetin dioxygenase-like cupin family protein
MRTAVRRGEGELLMLGGRRPIEILVERATTGTRAFTMGAQTIAPGGEVPEHKHPEEEILLLSPPGYEEFFRNLAHTQTDHAPASA